MSKKYSRIVDTMYCLIPMEQCDAKSITSLIVSTLKKDGLDLKKLCGIHNSISTMLREECSLHLAASEATKVLPKSLDFLVRETASWFSFSHKRRAEYTALYQTLNDGESPLKLSHLCMTRWLARRDIIGKILDQWDALKLMFAIMKDKDRCYTTEQLYEMYNDKRNKLYLTFLHFVLDEVCKVNVAFQSKNANPLLMFQDPGECFMKLLKMVVVPDHMKFVKNSNCLEFDFENFLMHTSSIYFGYNFQLLAENIENCQGIRDRCKDFFCELIKQVRVRLPNNFNLLQKMNCFSPKNVMSHELQEKEIIDFAAKFRTVIGNVDSCISELRMLVYEPALIEFVKKKKL